MQLNEINTTSTVTFTISSALEQLLLQLFFTQLALQETMAWMSSGSTNVELISNMAKHRIIRSTRVTEVGIVRRVAIYSCLCVVDRP